MNVFSAYTPAHAWIQITRSLLKKGDRVGDLYEHLNTVLTINHFKYNEDDSRFDHLFRKHFGDDRIDYASSVTFIKPDQDGLIPDYRTYEYHKNWHDTYWGRMVAWKGEFNQIENAINLLSKGFNTKRCELIVYDPKRDAVNMYKQPCLLAIDLKPREGKLHLSAMFRSQRISKSGYADYVALSTLNHWLASQVGLKRGDTTIFCGSCHLSNENREKTKSIALLDEYYEGEIWRS